MRLKSALWCLGLLLTACASSSSSLREDFEAPEPIASWQQARADASCVVLLCTEEGCALWRCRDTQEVPAHAVVPARGPLVLRPPSFSSPSRWWGHPLAVPNLSEPVFEIPWNNWKARDQRPKKFTDFCLAPQEPMEKHHIFPQQQELAEWFYSKGINIHDFTLPLPKSFHAWLHSGAPRGGQWNEAWRQFKNKNPDAEQPEIWKFAGELMTRFGVHGEFVRYCH